MLHITHKFVGGNFARWKHEKWLQLGFAGFFGFNSSDETKTKTAGSVWSSWDESFSWRHHTRQTSCLHKLQSLSTRIEFLSMRFYNFLTFASDLHEEDVAFCVAFKSFYPHHTTWTGQCGLLFAVRRSRCITEFVSSCFLGKAWSFRMGMNCHLHCVSFWLRTDCVSKPRNRSKDGDCMQRILLKPKHKSVDLTVGFFVSVATNCLFFLHVAARTPN